MAVFVCVWGALEVLLCAWVLGVPESETWSALRSSLSVPVSHSWLLCAPKLMPAVLANPGVSAVIVTEVCIHWFSWSLQRWLGYISEKIPFAGVCCILSWRRCWHRCILSILFITRGLQKAIWTYAIYVPNTKQSYVETYRAPLLPLTSDWHPSAWCGVFFIFVLSGLIHWTCQTSLSLQLQLEQNRTEL